VIQTPEALTVRPMGLEDIPSVRSIDRLSFALPWPESSYQYELNGSRVSHMLVAEADSTARPEVVGYLGFWLIVDEAHISTLAVHPDWRGRGVGRLLLRCGLNHAADCGARLATLEVRRSNQAAIQLYGEFGFAIVGRRPRYYRDNDEDALLMTLDEIRDQADAGGGLDG
jgi:ribosomal-protein-alanine N-acetyltransferase